MAALVIMRPQGLTSAADQTENPRTNNTKRPAVRQAEIEAECDVRKIIATGTPYGTILLSIRKSDVERKSRLARIGGMPFASTYSRAVLFRRPRLRRIIRLEPDETISCAGVLLHPCGTGSRGLRHAGHFVLSSRGPTRSLQIQTHTQLGSLKPGCV